MKILFFLVHPAHFHLFKNTIKALKTPNNKIQILIKTKDVLEDLLAHEGWDYLNTLKDGKRKSSKFSITISAITGLFKREYRLAMEALKNRPDIFIGTEWSLAHVGKLLNIPSLIVNEDDTSSTPENRFVYPFTKHIVMPVCVDVGKWKNRKIAYQGYHELAYLHPNYFKPNKNIVKTFNPNYDRYFLLRFVKLTASHDIGKKGLTQEVVRKIIPVLSEKGKVYITSERELEPHLERYRINISPHEIHHAIKYADLLIADSQTMVAEAAVLGTPSIRFNDFVGKLSYLEELEHKYRLTFGIKTSEPEKLYARINELLNATRLRADFNFRKRKMLSEKIDVTAFLVWLIKNYPDSARIMKENPNYQYRFRSIDYEDSLATARRE